MLPVWPPASWPPTLDAELGALMSKRTAIGAAAVFHSEALVRSYERNGGKDNQGPRQRPRAPRPAG